MELLERIKGKTLEKVQYHEWTSVEYKSLDWIQLDFSGQTNLCLHLGSGEESVEVLSGFDPGQEQKDLFEMFGERDVTVTSTDHSATRKWKNYVGEKVTGFRLEEGDGLVRSVTLLFGQKAVRVSAGDDNLEAKALSK